MHLIVIFLAEFIHLEKILKKFRELKISGVTILDSTGVGETSLYHQWRPMIACLHKLWECEGEPSKTLLSVVESEEVAIKLLDALKEIIGNLDEKETALAFSIPISNVTGLNKIK